MTSGTYERTSLDWQFQLWRQQFGEWWERIFDRRPVNIPEVWQLPEWLQRGLFWLMVVSAATWATWQLYKLLQPYWTTWQQHPQWHHRVATTSNRNSASIAEWLHRSRTAQQQGNYREACRALYMAALQQLHDRHLIGQEPSRTDGEYLYLTQQFDPAQPYQTLIQTHEQLYFGSEVASAELFDRCWQAYQQIEAPPGRKAG